MLAKDYAYIFIPVAVLPLDIIDHYKLQPLIHKACMDCPKPENLPMSSYKPSLNPMAITHAPSHQAYGLILPATSISPLF